jgi:hypothetical protein
VNRGRVARSLLASALLAASLLLHAAGAPSTLEAQDAARSDADASRTGATEEPDRTRLDVERLPPEAIPITRSLYAHGLYIEGVIGGRGFIGGIGRISSPGPMLAVRVGYEILDWLWIGAIAEGSMHQTATPPPPGRQVFELLGAMGDVRAQINPTAELAIWLAGQVGFIVASTDVLALYGQPNASTVSIAYGGELGVDAHFHARHLSIGLLAGTRLSPGLDLPGSLAIGIHGAAYVRYVF